MDAFIYDRRTYIYVQALVYSSLNLDKYKNVMRDLVGSRRPSLARECKLRTRSNFAELYSSQEHSQETDLREKIEVKCPSNGVM